MDRIRAILLLACVALGVRAQDAIERITLQDGSVLEGYISTQTPGVDIVFASQKSELVVDAAQVTVKSELDYKADELEEEWKGYVDKETKTLRLAEIGFSAEGNTSCLLADQILFLDGSKFCVKERGDKYRLFTAKTIHFRVPMSKIKETERIVPGKEVVSKTVDVLKLKSGKVIRGNIAAYVPGKTIKICIEHDTDTTHVAFADIESESREPSCSELTLYQQSKYTEKLITDSKEYTGVISTKFYGNEPYIEITNSENEITRVSMKDVLRIEKEVNGDYKAAPGGKEKKTEPEPANAKEEEKVKEPVSEPATTTTKEEVAPANHAAAGDDAVIYVNGKAVSFIGSIDLGGSYAINVVDVSEPVLINSAEGSSAVNVNIPADANGEYNNDYALIGVKEKKGEYRIKEDEIDITANPSVKKDNETGRLDLQFLTGGKGAYILMRKSDKQCVLIRII